MPCSIKKCISDNFMFLNQGKFRQNGGCGYVLKPKAMRNPTGTGKEIVIAMYIYISK